MERRDFLKQCIMVIAGASVPLSALTLVDPRKVLAANPEIQWAFLIDTNKCVGCGFCVKACKTENDIPFEANVTRTWVERYVYTKDDRRYVDSPKGALDGFTESRIDLGKGEFKEIDPKNVGKAFFVPKICNHCATPPCTQVCPVGATYKTDDGVVLVDRTWCIGCGYCIMACPYAARFFHPVLKVADKCTFCYHRISARACRRPASTPAPSARARMCNIHDINDPITQIIMNERVGVLKDEFGTKPQAFYIGLAQEVR